MSISFRFVKTLWGVSPLSGNEPSGYSRLFERIKKEGFTAVETPIWKIEDRNAFQAALALHQLGYVAMINTGTCMLK